MNTRAPAAEARTCDPSGGISIESRELESICRAELASLSPSWRGVRIVASFYPYLGLTHTIRRKDRTWIIRVSDHCRNAPRLVLEAIVVILACKVLRRQPAIAMVEVYTRFRREPEVQAKVRKRRLQRGRKRINTPRGKHHRIDEIYGELNERFFGNRLEISKLGWGTRASWRRLGHYDPIHHTITISPVLDSPRVPRSVLGYLIYHEMLHALFDDASAGGPRRHHTPEFRQAERQFPEHSSARAFLNKFCGVRGEGM